MPTQSDEITSFMNKALTMATKGGNIDIQSGMGPATGPNIYSSAMPKTKASSTVRTIHYFFIMHKTSLKNTIFC